MREKEFEGWFELKQILTKLVLNDIKEEWKAGNIPSTAQKMYEMINIVTRMIEESFGYLKELGEIYILRNIENNSDIILELEIIEKMGIRFDQDQNE